MKVTPTARLFPAIHPASLLVITLLVTQGATATAEVKDSRNRWELYHEFTPNGWRRHNHAGIAYDEARDAIYMFGSDTHGLDHDNSVYQFDIAGKTWTQHYSPSPLSSYQVSDDGLNTANHQGQVRPWAMHTYDNILFDPNRRALVITAFPEHNPQGKKMGRKGAWGTWLYYVDSRSWEPLATPPNQPKAFAAGSAYDPDGKRAFLYKWKMWTLSSSGKQWLQEGPGSKHAIHYAVEYDSRHRLLGVFGDHKNSSRVHLYFPGKTGEAGRWEVREPTGDLAPEDQHFPVAFSTRDGVFLLAPDDTVFVKQPSGYRKPIKPKRAFTFLYDVERNRYLKLPDAELPPLGMNYAMIYSAPRNAFFLLTGNDRLSVWRLKLDLEALPQWADGSQP
ncbi:hypothetical protein [Aestuariirhabdus litorea]|uniref:Exo-alpha-sialidase n=1 Tax=Aestuariirhabdus litorea TaxID=2528527 RepID=A0A3P3VT02_9GAMM|nr:hypothetical protein [Aestuariirhabdus litorea]RRJ84609.1 hypothetical protein D0544_05755 [Aestuariirhabdus litorea]RWW97835.1 hypothetical protein DZC74_05750 [Endozoicomonadaceae bacterium GTF-13]